MKNNHLEDQPASLLNFYEAWMEDFQRLVAGGLRSENTLRKHKVIYKQLSRFLRESMKTEDIHLTDAGPSFIVDFHLFLKQNYIWPTILSGTTSRRFRCSCDGPIRKVSSTPIPLPTTTA